ncbi:uncharacterized protein LOC110762444 [Prunus avium]|uniref:Uncharacterized protein LOC110762444 n=1 Tax=Prunus avium TaxID=42229 RepID=A0A6P5T2D3_PRUAV|nr:uncharacterized protein LOC110762444 [Prunus avium]
MNWILKGVKDVQNLSNSLHAQNEILQESHVELANQVHEQVESESANTPDTSRATSSSAVAEAPGQNVADARNILKEKKAWRERNKRLVEDIRKGKNRVSSEEAEEDVDDITSKLKDLVIGELKSVWDWLGQVEKSKMPTRLEFTEEEISLPYTRDLLHARVVGDSKAPKIPLYNGIIDPYDHLDNFRYATEGRDANEAIKCRMFPTTLKGPATSWFKRLVLESISSFAELRKVFLERYIIISDWLYTVNDLSTIRQWPDEKLRDYITWFNNEYARCEGCDEATTHNALMGELQGEDFNFSLTKNPPKTSIDLLCEVTSYSCVEQLNLARKATVGSASEAHTPYQPRDKRPNDYAYDHSSKRKKGKLGSLARKNHIRP